VLSSAGKNPEKHEQFQGIPDYQIMADAEVHGVGNALFAQAASRNFSYRSSGGTHLGKAFSIALETGRIFNKNPPVLLPEGFTC
jgi:hypothetical protein